MSLRNSRVVAITAGAAIIVAASSFGAVAAKLVTSADIKDQTIKKIDIKKGGVGGSEVKDKSLKVKDLSDDARAKLKGNTGPRGPQGPAGPAGPPAATTVSNLNGAFTATNPTVSLTADGVEFGPYADGGAEGGSLCYNGLNGQSLSAARNLVYHARYTSTNDTNGVGAPYLRIFTGNSASPNSSIFSPNTQAPDPDVEEGPFHEWVATSGSWRYNDDAGANPDITFAQLVADHGTEVVTSPGVCITVGFSAGVDLAGLLRSWEINGRTFDFRG
ncbi:MAG TPA: hypothetical protein VFH10_06735 [Nocardioides sp.]|uniref:hypothetical protein n=1 Tax=Nocardioides sp. TaxID=35761 RepID=UPI002D7ECC99|nr:hypothetical protein [Nocardioides sp.]HET6652320.1 hypothetical protein [Nocardioides sp.]